MQFDMFDMLEFDVIEFITANPILIIMLVVVLFLVSLTLRTFLGKSFKVLFGTYAKGRTKTEKTMYFFATVGLIAIISVFIFVAVIFELTTVDMDYIVSNIYYVGVVVFVLGFILITCLVFTHQRGTPLVRDMKFDNPFEKKKKKRFRRG